MYTASFLASVKRGLVGRPTESEAGCEGLRQFAQKPDAFGPLLKDVPGALRYRVRLDAEVWRHGRIGAHGAGNHSRSVEYDEVVTRAGSNVQSNPGTIGPQGALSGNASAR